MLQRLGRMALVSGLVATAIALFVFLVNSEHRLVILGAGALGVLLIIFYVFACLDDVKKMFSARSTRYGANMTLVIVVMVAIVFVVNYIAIKHPLRWEVNSDSLFSLSDQTKKVLGNIKEPVSVFAFYLPEESESGILKDACESYSYVSKNFQCSFVDYRRRPELVKTFGISQTGPRIVMQMGGKESRVKGVAEQDLTNGLIKLTRTENPKIYFTIGHGERAIEDKTEGGYSLTADSLINDGFRVASFNLMTEPIPADAAVIIVAAPKKPLLPAEVNALREYLDKGGHVLAMAEPETNTGLADLVARFNIQMGNDLVVDPMSRMFGTGASTPVVTQYAVNEITKGFNLMTFFPTARSVKADRNAAAGATAEAFAMTGPNAWADTNMEELKTGQATYHEGKDMKGPVPLAARSRKKAGGSEMKLVVFGDSDFASNQYRDLTGNGDLFNNSVSWLANQEDRITIRPKNRASSRVVLSQDQANFLQYFTVGPFPPLGVIPILLFVAAFITWRSRKNR